MLMRTLFAGVLAVLLLAAPAQAAVKKGPAGLDFYTPPKTMPKGTHGTPIWVRSLTGKAKLTSAKSNRLLLYLGHTTTTTPPSPARSTSRRARRKAGWPIVTGRTDDRHRRRLRASPWPCRRSTTRSCSTSSLKAGYAVVRTDYEGLGTPSAHPYLIGVSEGRAVLDMVRAARKLDRSLGKQVVIAGHSQGGHAALWAGSLAGKWTPELDVRGTLALAPASHLGEQAGLLSALTTPSRSPAWRR